jgi:Hydrazine synthase alpha subunit middle domain/WD40-like Beta Propeller Repeat
MNALARKASLALCAAAAATLALPSIGLTSGRRAFRLDELIVVQIPVAAAPRSQDQANLSTPLDRYVDGARIVRVDPSSGGVVVLTPEFTGACDPDVSFDGKSIVFAGRRDPEGSWQIWRMNADGSGKTQITRRPGQSVAPVFAGARFYLDDPQPTPQVIFAGSARDPQSFALYGTDLEGAALRRLTFNPHSDFSPAVLPTGQIVFSSWQRYGDRVEPDGIFALLAVNIDGTDLMPFYGNHEPPRYKDMAAVSPVRDRVYFVESDRLSWLGGGDLAYVSWRRPLHSHGKVNDDADGLGLFHSPTPLPDGGLLASYRRRASDSVFAVYRLDPESGRRLEKVFEQAGWHSIDAHVLAPRPPGTGRANWLKPGSTTGVFYCLNSYRTSPGEGGDRSVAPPGTIKHVRVIEGLPRRILGVAPVEPDGSFHIRVPAETPITFQLLDENFLALRTQRAWTWVMGNENRGCIGCHEDRELSPPNRLVTAIAKPPVDLVLPPARRRTVDFRHQIAPIIAARCATTGCHVAGQAAPVLGEAGTLMSESVLRTVYGSLLEQPEGHPDGRYVVPGRARESPLIRLLLRRDTDSRPTAGTPHDVLGRRELILFIEWVDLGAEWESRPRDAGSAP